MKKCLEVESQLVFKCLFQAQGIPMADLKKVKEAGVYTIEGIAYMSKKQLIVIKGISEQKAEKLLEAGMSSQRTCLGSEPRVDFLIISFSWKLTNTSMLDSQVLLNASCNEITSFT